MRRSAGKNRRDYTDAALLLKPRVLNVTSAPKGAFIVSLPTTTSRPALGLGLGLAFACANAHYVVKCVSVLCGILLAYT